MRETINDSRRKQPEENKGEAVEEKLVPVTIRFPENVCNVIKGIATMNGKSIADVLAYKVLRDGGTMAFIMRNWWSSSSQACR